jgi:DNA polymerase III alpha subunit
VVWDFIHHAQSQGHPGGAGRGSGAGSILAYALGITGHRPAALQPLLRALPEPRARVSPPDFDIDFCQWRRGEVIDYVKKKYGTENCAQIITFGSLGAKTVIRDLGRVLEIPLGECDRLAKMVPEVPDMTLEKALKESPGVPPRPARPSPTRSASCKYARGAGRPAPQPRHPRGRGGDRREAADRDPAAVPATRTSSPCPSLK